MSQSGKSRVQVLIRRACGFLIAAALVASPGIGAVAEMDHGQMGMSGTAPKGLDFSRSDEFNFDPPAPGSYKLPVIRQAADGRVLDIQGATQSLRALLSGKVTLLSFIYTRCTDAQGCPLATAVLYEISDASEVDPVLAKNLRMISLSFDPVFDTPEVMAKYRGDAASHKSSRAEWLDLTTASEADLAPILKDYDQVVRRRKDESGQLTDTFGHQLRAYLVDRRGDIRNIYGLGFLDPRLLATDVYTLLMEDGTVKR